jgi:dienelactone hydrolase
MRVFRRILLVFVLVLVLAVGAFIVWASLPAGALMPEAVTALRGTERVTVSTQPYLTFRPAEGEVTTGFVFYPGGKVQPEAYAPYAAAIAEQGYLVVVPAMPLQLAVFAPGTASAVFEQFPDITQWAVGGHSLGGAMAATFARANLDRVDGLVLWASFAQASDSLAEADLAVASVYGTLDGLATVEDIEASRVTLPPDAAFVAIEGGNHAQFGWYGAQAGDNPATVSHAEQMAQTVAATVAVLSAIAGG